MTQKVLREVWRGKASESSPFPVRNTFCVSPAHADLAQRARVLLVIRSLRSVDTGFHDGRTHCAAVTAACALRSHVAMIVLARSSCARRLAII